MRSLSTSPDGQWAVARTRRDVVLLAAGAGEPVGRLTLEREDSDVALIGPPNVLVVVSREGDTSRVVLHEPPYLDAVARHELDHAARLGAITGPRVALISIDGKHVTVVRSAVRALATQVIDVGGPIDFAVGLERNQLLFGLQRKLEVWDAVSGRPMLKLQLQLPPPPRTVGTAAGHLWATRPGSDEVFVYRLSDGRPFRHYVGAPIDDVISHPASPLIVLATRRGLVRLNCFAHSLHHLEAPWTPPAAGAPSPPLAQLVVGEDISLLGLSDGSTDPWRVAIAGVGAPTVAHVDPADTAEPALLTAADKLRAMRNASPDTSGSSATSASAPVAAVRPAVARAWRDQVAAYGQELARNVTADPPIVAIDTELGALARRLALTPAARSALIALYALHLVGQSRTALAQFARLVGDWSEALGQGELGALAMLRRKHGTVGLRRVAADLLDGAPPRAIRIVGGEPTTPRAGAFRVSRDGRTDAAIEAELATQLGRIAVIEGRVATGLLEARLHGATAVLTTVPDARPRPWPRDAGLVLVLYGTASAWVADVPSL